MMKTALPIFLSIALSLAFGIDFHPPMAKADFHLPLKRTEGPVFPLKLLADGENPRQSEGIDSDFQIGLGTVRAFISLVGGASITGEGKGGKVWEVKLKNIRISLGYQLYSGDLDNNGLIDLVLVTYTGANGFLPYSILSIITFDSQGLPVLLQDGQDVEAKNDRVTEIVDLDRDGRAELIATHYDNDDGKDKWDGYFITDIYKVEDAHWRRLSLYENYSFPVYAHWSSESNEEDLIRIPENLAPGRHPAAPDLSMTLPVESGRIMDVNRQENGLVSFKVRTSKGDLVRTFRELWDKCYQNNFVLIIDTKEKRQIIALPEDRKEIDLDLQIVKYRNASLYGNCAPGKLSPNLIWITK